MPTGTRTALSQLQEIAKLQQEQTGTGPQKEWTPSPSMTNLLSKPVWYYNSRYKSETFSNPYDPNRRDPESFTFLNGQYCATKEWQKDVLDKQGHVYPEDIGMDAIDPCPECGYKTGSMKDFNAHMRSHL
jgi:hypothetical protein